MVAYVKSKLSKSKDRNKQVLGSIDALNICFQSVVNAVDFLSLDEHLIKLFDKVIS